MEQEQLDQVIAATLASGLIARGEMGEDDVTDAVLSRGPCQTNEGDRRAEPDHADHTFRRGVRSPRLGRRSK